MARFVTSQGAAYYVDEEQRIAFPEKDPGKHKPYPGNNYNPSLDWGEDVARACGLVVDGRLPEGDYRVRNAGPEWYEVWKFLRSLS